MTDTITLLDSNTSNNTNNNESTITNQEKHLNATTTEPQITETKSNAFTFSFSGLKVIGNVVLRYIKDQKILDENVVSLYEPGVIYLTSIKINYSLGEVWWYDSPDKNSKKYALIQDDCGYSYQQFKNNEIIYIGGDPLVVLEDYHAHEIMPNLYLGNITAASNIHFLNKRNITHILTVARNLKPRFPNSGIEYKIISVWDDDTENLLIHFDETYTFIDKAAKSGAILVHCAAGVSRSATVVIAYLMKQNQWTVEKAKDFVYSKRSCIHPNEGFVKQLQTYYKNKFEVTSDSTPPASSSSSSTSGVS